MISKVTKNNKALYDARLAEINEALHANNLIPEEEVVDTIETYFMHIEEILQLPVKFTDPDAEGPDKQYLGKYFLMPLDEPLFEIDANKRLITVPTEFAKNGVGVKGDHSAEILYFCIDRYFDARDLYSCDYITINWQFRAANESRNKEVETHQSIAFAPDETYITDLKHIVFGWIITNEMTPSKGTLSFSVSFADKLSDNTYAYTLNTMVASVAVNDSLHLEDPSVLSTLKRPIIQRLKNSQFTPEDAPAVNNPVWRTGQAVVWDEEEDISGLSGLPLITNFEYFNGEEKDTVLLQAVGAVDDQEGVNIKYTWSGMKFDDGESVGRRAEIVRDAEGPSKETDWVVTKDTVAQPGIVYWTGDGRVKTRLAVAVGEPLEGTVYELGSSFEAEAAGDYLVEMQATRMGATSRSIASKHCIIPHAAIPEVALKVSGIDPDDANEGYEIDNADIAAGYTFISDSEDDSFAVKAIVTKDETNVKSRKDVVGVEVVAKKLETAPDDMNKEASQANQDAVEIKQKDNDIIILCDLASLNSFESTNPAQGEAKWVGIDLETNINDITKLTWSGSPLEQADVEEAASVGLGDGHIIFWAKVDQLPKIITLGRPGYADIQYRVLAMSPEEFVEDEAFDNEAALENARKGIIKESELGKIAFIIAEGESEPSIEDFANASWEKYELNKTFDIPNDNASAEGTYCVYAANERNHSYSISKRSDLINVSRIAPKVQIGVIGSYNGADAELIIDNENQGNKISMERDLGYDCDLTISVSGISAFIDPVEVQLEAVEVFGSDFDRDNDIVPNIYEISDVDENDNYVLKIEESGQFVIRATTFYHGTKRVTETEPFVITWDK